MAPSGTKRFGPWAVERRLGAGGMGEVLLARGPGDRMAAIDNHGHDDDHRKATSTTAPPPNAAPPNPIQE